MRSKLRTLVETFLEDDKYSRLAAGKKEFIKWKKLKKQKRYRLDTLRNLHKKFVKTGTAISYSMFARLRPFWVVAPKVTDRDTCMCVMHSNLQLLVTAMNKAKVLKVTSYQNLLTTICCDCYNERCLERVCEGGCTKSIPLCEDIDDDISIKYQQWESTQETIVDSKSKKKRTVIKQKKTTFEASPQHLVGKLENGLEKMFSHERNIVHQHVAMKTLKESLRENDAVVHMDFSENYSTKYSEEIQSFHFGGSRTQISLHTVVVYLQNSKNCTVSTNLSHNVPAIWAHLKPVLEELPANIENINFLSDGPVTQYRNKLMFYVLACKMSEIWPNFITFTWNYHEAGHGKGAPDGVGATCKRTADSVVASGGDVANLTQFCSAIQNRCPNITLFRVTTRDIEQMDALISRGEPRLLPFKGTLQVHQVQGNAYMPQKVVMKSLSCFCSSECDHYRLGTVKYSTISKVRVDDIFGESDTEKNDGENIGKIDLPNVTDDALLGDLTLTVDDPDGLLTIPDVDIDPQELFPEDDKEIGKDNKLNGDIKEDKKVLIRKNKTEKKRKVAMNKKRIKSGVKVKANEKKELSESDTCRCIFYGALYSEDNSGQDWFQCVVCREWAQISCITTDPVFFTCQECSPDSDYEP
nr:unnamed protein product [Callosobruchus chinensis]